ncbi:IS110 family transposase [Streptomyces sp. NBC_00353]
MRRVGTSALKWAGRGCPPHSEAAGPPYPAPVRGNRRTQQADSRAVEASTPGLREVRGVGPDSAAALLITAGDNPERLANEASFAALCGTSPVEASSGKTQRRRLNRGGGRQANAALYRIVLSRLRWDDRSDPINATSLNRLNGRGCIPPDITAPGHGLPARQAVSSRPASARGQDTACGCEGAGLPKESSEHR